MHRNAECGANVGNAQTKLSKFLAVNADLQFRFAKFAAQPYIGCSLNLAEGGSSNLCCGVHHCAVAPTDDDLNRRHVRSSEDPNRIDAGFDARNREDFLFDDVPDLVSRASALIFGNEGNAELGDIIRILPENSFARYTRSCNDTLDFWDREEELFNSAGLAISFFERIARRKFHRYGELATIGLCKEFKADQPIGKQEWNDSKRCKCDSNWHPAASVECPTQCACVSLRGAAEPMFESDCNPSEERRAGKSFKLCKS
ncbi:hypothetical protein HRbin20_01451 [bacterium HR20]|nr:hypothetical protein HRbin20_01451 [bacterium HR20]